MNSKNNQGLFSGLKDNQKWALVIMALLAVALVICLIIIVISSIDFSKPEPETPSPDISTYTIGATKAKTFTEKELFSGTLMVVNKNHKFNLPESEVALVDPYEYRLAHEADAKNPAYRITSSVSIMLTQETTENLHEMLTDLNKTTGNFAYIITAHRTLDEQKNYSKPAESGYSDFHTGMLVSLKEYIEGTAVEITAESSEDMYNWLLNNAHNYGFIQRYPEGKETVTGVTDYLSCFRYVGIAHATYMKNEGYCLEEYIAHIEEEKPTVENPIRIEVRNDGVKEIYAIYYVTYNGGSQEIQVPTTAEGATPKYTISATNTGGVIVTVKLK